MKPGGRRVVGVAFLCPQDIKPLLTEGREFTLWENMLIEKYGGSQSMDGSSPNKINGVSTKNVNRIQYYRDALREFGE
ncbi:hypothetical protein C8J98_102659 [Luteibacter sp. OK325]|nr:hypothetical protein C8J98_102659 [Luteibacter sp. OK325]